MTAIPQYIIIGSEGARKTAMDKFLQWSGGLDYGVEVVTVVEALERELFKNKTYSDIQFQSGYMIDDSALHILQSVLPKDRPVHVSRQARRKAERDAKKNKSKPSNDGNNQ